MNKNIDFSNSFFRGLNYFSFYWGYDKYFSNELVVGAKFKFVKGVSRFGLDIQNVNMSLINNIATENNPFSTNSHIDLYYFTNNNFDIFSNPGLAFDFSMQYKLGQSTFFYTSISELGFIVWQEDQYAYQGSFEYDGLNYDLNQDIAVEFNNLFDSIVNLIDTKDISNVSKVDFLPFSIDLGFTYNTDVNFSKFMINYNLKKLTNSLLHTGSVSYLYYFPSYQICLVPNYSVNKFNYFNLSFFFQKKWFDKLYTNFYLKNCVGFINENSRARNVGFGMELLLLF
ncbi:MAG: hypothetical protein CMP49_03570 [Flavobacteriales bacterium]|nr:hypothetical protein [Flavobacteriales bacterium]